MHTPDALTVNNWRHASSSADINLKITSTHAAFALPVVTEPIRTAPVPTRIPHSISPGSTNDFFGMTRLCATRGSRHDSYFSFGPEFPPPPYPDVGLPAYSAKPNTEPSTLAMYLFKSGFVFPPCWILGIIILICPLTAPPDFEPLKSETERLQLVQIVRDAELRWAKRCAWALATLLIIGGFAVSIILGVLRS